MHLSASYRPGPLLAAIGPRAVLVWRPPAGPTPSAAWQAVAEGAPVGQVLPLLASTGSWTQLPDFALVLAETGGLRVLVRGALRVHLLRTDGDPVHVGGADAVTWTETLVPGAASATVGAEPDGEPEPTGFPIVAGVVAVAALTWAPDAKEHGGDEVDTPSAARATPTAALPAASAGPSGLTATMTPTATGSAAAPAGPAAAAPAPLESPLGVAAAPAAVAVQEPLRPEALVEQTLPPSAYDHPHTLNEPSTDAAAAPDLPATADAETSLSYDLLYGTRPYSGPQAPAPLEPPDPPVVAPPPLPAGSDHPAAEPAATDTAATDLATTEPPGVEPPAVAAPAPAAPGRAASPAPGLITSSPWRLSAAPATDGAAALPLSPFAGPAEATVRRGAEAATALPDGRGEPDEDVEGWVEAVRCRDGHLNPPQARSCRVCAGDVPVQTSVRLPRPALGVLHLYGADTDQPTGPRTVTVDRPLVLGRQPRASGLVRGELPGLITLPLPNDDISRSHVQLEIDGWRLLARDLGSANGTLLDTRSGAPVRLDPQQPVEVVAGARLIFSDDVSVTFEAR